MFSKLWKTLKFFLILGIILICLPHSIFPKKNAAIRQSDLEIYLKLNNEESRLPEFKDDEEALKLKLGQLEIINSSRRKHNAAPVKLDILASRVGNKIAREAAENKFLGHWNLAGENPYQRYGFAGGSDHVSENAFGEWTSDNYVISAASIATKMEFGHNTFMSEKPPYDGHKINIIEKSHNWVGIGYYMSGNQFRYYEEFIDRYLEYDNIPQKVKTNVPFQITVRTSGKEFLYYLIIYRDDFPKPMKPGEISSIGSYNDFTDEQYLRLPAWDLAAFRNGREYRIPLSFSKEGLFYIQIYIDNKEISGPSSVNTMGKVPVSGIVIRAEKE